MPLSPGRMALLAALPLLSVAASPSIAAETEGSIAGFVFDAAGGGPLAGARIGAASVDDPAREIATAVTDGDGAFRLLLPPGTYRLAAEAAGRVPFAVPEPLSVVAGETGELTLSLGEEGYAAAWDYEAPGAPAAPAAIQEGLPMSAIGGRVIHEETRQGVSGFRVFVRGLAAEARTGEDGVFRIEVPVGTHQVSFVHPEFSTISRSGIEVVAGADAAIEVEAVPVGVMLEDLPISAPRVEGGVAALLQERQESGSVSDVIGAEQMARSGDSDAAGALKRVTGVTIIDGKYVYVRGLGERYSSTLLNGANLPSPEPERRVVPLDLFPTGILDSVVIQKTYSPDMPGEFGGGVVMLRTRDYPDEFTFKLSLKGGFGQGTTGTRGLMAEGSPTDWLGWDRGWRDLPADVREASKDQQLLEGNMFTPGYTAEELEKFGESLRNNWRTHRGTIPPDAGGDLTVGHAFDIGRARLGFLAAAVYANEWDREEKSLDILAFGADEAEVFHSYEWDETTNEIKAAGILTVGLELGEDHLIRSTTLLNRITDDSARLYWGYNRDVGSDISVTRIRWVEQQLLTQQLAGEHVIPPLMDLGIDWRYTYSRATRHEPDVKEVTYYYDEGFDVWVASNRPDGNSRVFTDVRDEVHDLSLDLTLPFEQWSDEIAQFRVGGLLLFKDREADTRRFKYKDRPSELALATLPPEELFSPELIGWWNGTQTNNLFTEVTRETDNYTAGQEIQALYAMTDFPLGFGVRVVGGVRLEQSRQVTSTFALFDPDLEPVESTIDTTDWLPAATVSWEFVEEMVARVGVSQTVSRPDFREMSPARFTDVIGGRDVVGNPDLERTLITSVDARWEWYPGPGETISCGGFYKYFEAPIELLIMPGAQYYETFANAKAAQNFGLELDLYKSFDWIDEALEDFYLAGNATWVRSRIDLGEDAAGAQTNRERPLQGQSPWIFNAQLGYENIDWGTRIAVLYNVFGERIRTVGAAGLPDIFEQPFHQLDFVASQQLGAGFAVGFRARNLLDLPVEFTQAGHVTETTRKGRHFQLSASWSY
jgi:outer membrane receptor protein involved in Fe transport